MNPEVELIDLLRDFPCPEFRKEPTLSNFGWLNRNLGTTEEQKNHPNIMKIRLLVRNSLKEMLRGNGNDRKNYFS